VHSAQPLPCQVPPQAIQPDGTVLLFVQFRRESESVRAALALKRSGTHTIHTRFTYSDPLGLYDPAPRVIFESDFYYAADDQWAVILRKDDMRVAYGDPALNGNVLFRLISAANPRLSGWETVVPRFYFDYVVNK
jgi:hypothetical protein